MIQYDIGAARMTGGRPTLWFAALNKVLMVHGGDLECRVYLLQKSLLATFVLVNFSIGFITLYCVRDKICLTFLEKRFNKKLKESF